MKMPYSVAFVDMTPRGVWPRELNLWMHEQALETNERSKLVVPA